MKYTKSWPMLQKERERRLRSKQQRGDLQNLVLIVVGILVLMALALAIVNQHDSNKTANNICFNTDPMYGCSINHP